MSYNKSIIAEVYSRTKSAFGPDSQVWLASDLHEGEWVYVYSNMTQHDIFLRNQNLHLVVRGAHGCINTTIVCLGDPDFWDKVDQALVDIVGYA